MKKRSMGAGVCFAVLVAVLDIVGTMEYQDQQAPVMACHDSEDRATARIYGWEAEREESVREKVCADQRLVAERGE